MKIWPSVTLKKKIRQIINNRNLNEHAPPTTHTKKKKKQRQKQTIALLLNLVFIIKMFSDNERFVCVSMRQNYLN